MSRTLLIILLVISITIVTFSDDNDLTYMGILNGYEADRENNSLSWSLTTNNQSYTKHHRASSLVDYFWDTSYDTPNWKLILPFSIPSGSLILILCILCLRCAMRQRCVEKPDRKRRGLDLESYPLTHVGPGSKGGRTVTTQFTVPLNSTVTFTITVSDPTVKATNLVTDSIVTVPNPTSVTESLPFIDEPVEKEKEKEKGNEKKENEVSGDTRQADNAPIQASGSCTAQIHSYDSK